MITACLDDDDSLTSLGEHRGGHPAATTGADHDDIGLESGVTRDGDDVQCPAGVWRWILCRPGVFHADPQWIAPIGSGQAVGEQHRQLIQRGDRRSGLGRYGGDVGEDLLAGGLGLLRELEKAEAVHQLQQAGELILGQVREEVLLGCGVGPHITALGCVKAVRIVLAGNGCDERVDDRGQRLALRCGELDGHRRDLSGFVGC